MRNTKKAINVLLGLGSLCFVQCYSVKWNSSHKQEGITSAPNEIKEIFNTYPDEVMVLDAQNPGYKYKYDIGEKDVVYGSDSLNMRFNRVEIKLKEETPKGMILADLSFVDGKKHRIDLGTVDLLRWIPKLEGPDALVNAEMLLKEYNRFGYSFRKEHGEFTFFEGDKKLVKDDRQIDRIYRCSVVNNCLAPGKFELELYSEDYSDFKNRVKGDKNLNQTKIISHSWFYLNDKLYKALLKLKNPTKKIDVNLSYDEMSILAEQEKVDYNELRRPLKYQLKTELLEVGHKSSRIISPLDVEQCYKKEFGLFLNNKEHTYASILESPVLISQFRDEGFYKETSPRKFDFSWMKHMDEVDINVIEVKGTDVYVEISLGGKWSPYNLTIGNIDLSQLDEQKLLGFLFGINTYPKSRRYNPVQSTISFDPDFLPLDIKPYLFLTDSKKDTWVNNQYKGLEKIYLTYETLEKETLLIYVLSYERVTPVWMARVKLPKNFREKVRIRKNLYNK